MDVDGDAVAHEESDHGAIQRQNYADVDGQYGYNC